MSSPEVLLEGWVPIPELPNSWSFSHPQKSSRPPGNPGRWRTTLKRILQLSMYFQRVLSLTEMFSGMGPMSPRGALSIICQAKRCTVMGDKEDDCTTQNREDAHENWFYPLEERFTEGGCLPCRYSQLRRVSRESSSSGSTVPWTAQTSSSAGTTSRLQPSPWIRLSESYRTWIFSGFFFLLHIGKDWFYLRQGLLVTTAWRRQSSVCNVLGKVLKRNPLLLRPIFLN